MGFSKSPMDRTLTPNTFRSVILHTLNSITIIGCAREKYHLRDLEEQRRGSQGQRSNHCHLIYVKQSEQHDFLQVERRLRLGVIVQIAAIRSELTSVRMNCVHLDVGGREGITVCLVSVTFIYSTTKILGQRDINHVRKEESLVAVLEVGLRGDRMFQ